MVAIPSVDDASIRWFGRNNVWQTEDKDGHMAVALHWASFDNLVENIQVDGCAQNNHWSFRCLSQSMW
jgi:hypothetical protein